jgi:Bacterial Ig-like domain/WD40-like Beta Propeller Repeat
VRDSTAIFSRRFPSLARLVLTLAACLPLASLAVACTTPPQIVAISPGRGTGEVPTIQPIKVVFDRPMDRASVASRFHLDPQPPGSIHWLNDETLVFDHAVLHTRTEYRVVIEAGYRDAAGGSNPLRHDWKFTTEAPPTLVSSSPSNADTGVDPATYLSLTFSRPMSLATLQQAISIGPGMHFSLRVDAADPSRVLLAPQSLLSSDKSYPLNISSRATDLHGNRLATGISSRFQTDARQPLRSWISFLAEPQAGQTSGGVWIVNDLHFPRPLVSVPANAYSWSGDGSRLLVQGSDHAWSLLTIATGSLQPLPFQASWAGFLADDGSYAFLNQGHLWVDDGRSPPLEVGNEIHEAAVSPDGTTIAFVVDQPGGGSELDAYNVDLRSHYRLGAENGLIDQVTWAPDAQAIAYRLTRSEPNQRQIRVRSLTGSGDTTTWAQGRVSSPAWQSDSQHLLFQAEVGSSAGPATKLFRRGASDGSSLEPDASTAMPSSNSLDVESFAVSPDGRQVVFISGAKGRASLWSMNADGTGLTTLTGAQESALQPAAPAWI